MAHQAQVMRDGRWITIAEQQPGDQWDHDILTRARAQYADVNRSTVMLRRDNDQATKARIKELVSLRIVEV